MGLQAKSHYGLSTLSTTHDVHESKEVQGQSFIEPLYIQTIEQSRIACNEGDLGSIPGSGRSTEEGNGYPLKYSCLENSMDRGAWRTTVLGVAKCQT